MAYKLAAFEAEIVEDGKNRRAIKVRQAGGRPFWLPKSQIRRRERVPGAGNLYRLVIPAWLAEQKRIEDCRVE
jgi:hypothetical protein